MSKLNYIKGDLFTTDCEIIAHGVNCRGKFGSGVAGQIRKLYPRVREAYLEKHELYGWKLGQIQFVYANGPERVKGQPYWIVNMATQDACGYDGKVYVDYLAVELCFNTLFRFCEYNKDRIAIPKVGCGLAGGEWPQVESILLKLLQNRDLEVNVYTL
jgi:O-acetyl-ADP-ribose deacetylase (regulator of RNase III)